MEIQQYFSHEHVLSLSEKKSEEDVISCRKCDFALHESCEKLPQELHNPLLHPHPLSLVHAEYGQFDCCACGKICRGFTFRCDKCNVTFDVKCAFIRPRIEEREEPPVGTLHFSHHHRHPLLLFQNMPADHINCSVCGKYCSDPMSYGCLACRFFLHPSCFELPQEIFHPFHPYHPLKTLRPTYRKCNACRKKIGWNNLAYVCESENCSFCLHLECSVIRTAAISYEGHDHLLQFKDNTGDELIKCSACNSTCKSYAFCCLYCDFNLHLTCGPLPYTIKHKCHIDPLILTHSLAIHELDQTDDEFYCDACEEERDQILTIYYCKECHFVAEISCVFSEVVSLLKGEHGDVELRNPFGQFAKPIREKEEELIKPASTLFDILKSLSEEENKELRSVILGTLTTELDDRASENDIEEYIVHYLDKAYTQLIKFLDIGIEIPTELRDEVEDFKSSDFMFWHNYKQPPKEHVVNIEDYKVTRKLAPILKDLLSKHGDVSVESKLSPGVKLYFFHMLCECIYYMINTKAVDITEVHLLNCWTSLKTLQFTGFRIQFAFDQLKRVALAHFAERQASNALDKLNRDIEALEGKRERIKSFKSSLNKEYSREASITRRGKAGVGLL
ncbi:uncharacterized protein LOC132164591 [Corylus avellana]|uniref:uncharacterized protein LOC132164591 n=1 Tax=Corylus avellana TaxID=13451 RepID=UPI00286C9D26|nr:uncharacterized protein LOC132164591 [Corylus avellana]XP_059431120.1 uncharacterized protein LOC132164591 [Corylus avellana]